MNGSQVDSNNGRKVIAHLILINKIIYAMSETNPLSIHKLLFHFLNLALSFIGQIVQ